MWGLDATVKRRLQMYLGRGITARLGNAYRAIEPYGLLISSRSVRSFALALGLELDKSEVVSIVREIGKVRKGITGRYCNPIDDQIALYLSRFAAAQFCPDPVAVHIEIGTLFGGSLIATLFAIGRAERKHGVVAIDPLTGYYGQSSDPNTGVEVTQETVEHNVVRLGFPLDRVNIFPYRSDDSVPLANIGQMTIASLFIDGDHSYDGIKADWENYVPHVIPSGLVVIDNYEDPSWPEVTQYVVREVRNDPRVVWLGQLGSTVVFKRIATSP